MNRFRNIFRDRQIILAIVASVLVVIATIVVLLRLNGNNNSAAQSAASQVAQNFYAAVKDKDYTKAYTYFADQQQAKITQYSFELVAQQQDTQNGAVTNYTIVRFDRDTNYPDQATIMMHVTRGSSNQYDVHLQMIQQSNGGWKILEEDRPI
jgi:Domain of unknown function (DUF4878)